MSQREDALKFETGRIKALMEERLHIQKKTFTKWMNSFLVKARMEVEDLFTDLADGKMLLKLLEIISGEKLGKPNNGRMRVHKIENVNKSLAFLHTKVRLESIGAEDIVDGNPRLILGLIWTIILRFQIQEIEIDVDEENESSEKKSAKDALLLWCQRKTNGYPNVNIQDFSGSWRSGLGFNALIHAHRPDLIEFDKLVPSKHIDNLNNAFDVAERQLGIAKLLDPEDCDTAKPDEKSVITYVASYYHTFAQMYNKDKSGRRIVNIVSQIKEADDLKEKYELGGKSLLTWIRKTIKELNSREFPNNLEGVQKLLQQFKNYITVHKPPKYNEKSEIEANYFIINTRLKELNRNSYVPPEGLLVQDIERAWEELERSEYQRELALREEVLRQTNLEQLGVRFEKKSLLREGYLKDMIQVLSDPRYGINLAQVEATLKKHEAISADILAREQRCEQLVTMADYLVRENYHGAGRVKARADEIMGTWDKLIGLLDAHKGNLEKFSALMQMIRDIDTLSETIKELQVELSNESQGVHLEGVEGLLHGHSLVESQISSMGDTIKRIGKMVRDYGGKEREMVDGKILRLNEDYAKLCDLSRGRRGKLEDSRSYFQFVQDCEEEEAWVNEKSLVFCQPISCKDLRGVLSLIQAHKIRLDEVKGRRGKFNGLVERGGELCRVWEDEGSGKGAEVRDVKERVGVLEGKWDNLIGVGEERSRRLGTVLEAFQFYSDANEMDSWVTEKRPLVSSSDYGEDEPSAQALLRRHVNLEEEIIAYSHDVKGLNGQADKLVKAGINSIQELSEDKSGVNGVEEEFIVEKKLVPEEYFEDEVVERTDYKTVTEERAVAQVKALYGFSGQEIEIVKGEVMFLLNKTNSDWWNVRKANGDDGFVPANYVKEIEPKVVMVQVRKPEVVKETKRVKKTRMVLQNVTKPAPKKPTPNTGTLKKSQSTPSQLGIQSEPILNRTQRINSDYNSILELCKVRKRNLQESIQLFQFLRECDDFEKWIGEKKKYLSTTETNVQTAKLNFETFLTDLSASNARVKKISKLVKDFEAEGCAAKVLEKVRNRGNKVLRLYDELLGLKSSKEKTLEGALSVELFNRTCEEVQDWMGEKMMQIDTDEWSNDLKTVQALQRKHQNLERELAPINEKVLRVEDLAESVKRSYPNETQNVEERKREVVDSWGLLVSRANERKEALENAVGLQIFVQGVKNLMHWVSGVNETLDNYVGSKDVSSAEDMIKCNSDLGDEIKGKVVEFRELEELGGKIRGQEGVGDKIELLKSEEAKLIDKYSNKTDWLNQVLDLQVFLREADHIDSCTRNQVQFLSGGGVGGNLDEIESLIKRHSDFENSLVAGDERVKIFCLMGGKLVDAGHFESSLIEERKNGVVGRREQVKDLSKTRKHELLRSLKYHEFNNDVEETLAWVNEKIAVAKDESYKDLALVDKKLKKHEAFAGELRANEVRIKNINRAGEKLVEVVPEKEPEIRKSISKLNGLWEELVLLSGEKYDKLKQAEAQSGFNKNLDSVVDRLGSIKSNLTSNPVVNDRRSCKDAVKRANSLGNELGVIGDKIKELEGVVEDMEKEKHFDRERIRERVNEAKVLMNELVKPVEELKVELSGKYDYYCFLYELGVEGGWIGEKRSLVEQDQVVGDLYQAQTVVKKHKKIEGEVMNREPTVMKLLEKGLQFSQYPDVHEKLEQFKNSWEALKSACTSKSKKLDLLLKSQQFFFDVGEIETWMQEKQDALSSKHYGKDIHSAVKLLTKHKTLELEMDSYNGLVQEMKHMANAMVQSNHPDKVAVSAKIKGVEDTMGLLRKLGNERREKLIKCVHTLEYFAEADEFSKIVDEVFGREVGSCDYGDDYEKLCVLKNRFKEVELKVDGVNERFKGLDGVAGKLVGSGDVDVGGRNVAVVHEELREKWNTTLSQMASREQKLHAAGEIHAFNRDVADALARINEKLNSIPEIVGRDVNSCESMLRQHEAFENDLLALEAQLQVLVDDASRLQTLYPSNAENIKQEQALVIESWGNLQNRAGLRKEQLQNAVDFWRFSAEYANLTSFVNSLLTTLPSNPKVRDTASSQALMNEHERIRGEIDARNDQFSRVFGLGVAMVEEGHPESGEVERMVNHLRGLREKLDVAWEHKKVFLDQLIDLNIFLRDAKQLETVCFGQEVSLKNIEVGGDVESVGEGVKRFVEFEKVVEGQEEKFKVLESQGGKLVRQGHFESDVVQERLKEVAAARANVKKLCKVKREGLEARLKYVQFIRDVNETTAWVDEKIKKLKHDESVNSGLNLQEKIKKLKKHQAFSAEVSSNREVVEGLFKTAKDLKADQDVVELRERWSVLVGLVQEFGKGLDEAYDILEFTNQCEQTDEWVREKESLVHSGDTGRDFEHCSEIIKRLEEVDRDRVDHRIKSLNHLADKLVSVTGDSDGVIERTRSGLNSRWENLKGNLEAYRVRLNKALETHKYNRDAEEIEERIDSKLPQLSVQDVGRNLESCEGLCRKQDALEAQVHAVGERVKELEGERGRLIGEGIDEIVLKKLGDKWLQLSEACLSRRSSLTNALEYHKFLKKFNELKGYFEGVRGKVRASELGGNVQEAEEGCKILKELVNNVVAREGAVNEVVKIGKRYVVEDHEYSKEFKERVGELEELRGSVVKELKQMGGKFDQCLMMQRLFSRINEVEAEIEYNESFLNRHELGESLGAVVVLVRHHGDFVQNFGGIELKVAEVISEGEALIPGHYDAQAITTRLNDLKSKLDRLKSRAQTRATKLHESYELHKFVLEIHELENYALEKLKIACDDNYSDMTNLQSKIQRHAAFESEVKGAEGRVSEVVLRSEELLNLEDEGNALHGFMVEIHKRIENLRVVWKELISASNLKRERLGESYQALLFGQSLDDIEAWMDEIESQLESEDHGSDLESVEGLILKWVNLESEFNHKSEVITGVGKSADAFVKAEHYAANDIVTRVDGLKQRYEALREPLHIRRENLDETRLFYEFLRDVDEEVSWVNERVFLVREDADLGGNLSQVVSLQKKHNQVESEVYTHEAVVSSICGRGQGLVKRGHFASDSISESCGKLSDRFRELKDSCAVRRLRLADSLLSQGFFDEAGEVLGWVGEKREFVRGVEVKEENCSRLLKRLEVFSSDLSSFGERVERVCGSGEELVKRGHFDGVNVKARVDEVKREFGELQKDLDKKICKVRDAKKFYSYSRACSDVVDWVNELMGVAGSEDYGKDVDHVEVLIQKFEGFVGSVQEVRVSCVKNLADELVEEGYPDVERVRGKEVEVFRVWEEFKELSAARLEALQGAKQVHLFDRTADETISWINEKHAVVCSEDYGHDLESIQSLIRRHGVFENDLKPVEAKVTEVQVEAERLRNLFPDASEHVRVKEHACVDAWKELVEKTQDRASRLSQAEKLQAYFDKYTELMAYTNEMVAKVTSGELGRNVVSAEGSLAKNKGYLKEIKLFTGVDEFCRRGEELVASGHFMGEEIREKIRVLSGRWGYLRNVVKERDELFTRNLDLRVYLVQLEDFDKWLSGKEPELREVKLGESIHEVEEIIREHEEFVHSLEAQESRVEGLRRRTLIEEAWENMKSKEREEKEAERVRLERERVNLIKRKEVERITNEIKLRDDESGKGRFGRFGSFVFGKDGRRGSEPTTPTREVESLKQINLTPPPSLGNLGYSQQETSSPLSRSESLRLLNTTPHDIPDTATLKKPKRTPSFTTRRRTASFRNKKKNPENLPPVEIEGYLERKHELQAGGKRAAVRSWKHYYVLLCGQLICFFKDQEDFEMSKVGSSSPISVYMAKCEVASDYTKRKFVFRVKPTDGSEFLFAAESRDVMDGWVKKINFHAGLEPKNQLERMDDGGVIEESRVMPPPPPPPKKHSYDTSTDDDEDFQAVARKPKPRGNLQQPRSREPIYANHEEPLDNPEVSLRNPAAKPPIPPRSSSIVFPEPNGRSPTKQNGSNDTIDNQQYFLTQQSRPVSVDRTIPRYYVQKPDVPYGLYPPPPAPLPRSIQTLQQNNTFKPPQYGATRGYPLSREFISVSSSLYRGPTTPQPLTPRSSGSLPPGISLQQSPNTSFNDPNSSSENEQALHSSSPSPRASQDSHDGGKKGKKGKPGDKGSGEGSGLLGLFKRKKATQL